MLLELKLMFFHKMKHNMVIKIEKIIKVFECIDNQKIKRSSANIIQVSWLIDHFSFV